MCGTCGARYDYDPNHCRVCGSGNIILTPEAAIEQSNTIRNGLINFIAVFCAFLVILAIILYFIFHIIFHLI